MKTKFSTLLSFVLVVIGYLTMGAGCSSDPNVEGGKLNLNNKEYDKALTNFEKALATNPQNAEAWKFKAQALLELAKTSNDPAARATRYASMAEAVGKAKSLNPAFAKEVGNYALAAWANEMNDGVASFNSSQAGMTDKASGHFKNATVILPDSTYGFELLGRSYYKGEKYGDAAPAFEESIKRGKAKEDTYLLLSNIYLYLIKDRAADALRVLEAGAQRYPNNETMRDMLTDAYRKSGQADRAIENYKAQLAASPNNFDVLLRYGNLLLQLEKWDDAIPVLERAYGVKKDDENAVYNLGIAYFNKAAAINKKMNETSDLKEADRLKVDRDGFFRKAMPLLEQTRQLYTAAKKDTKQICQSLFSIYAQIKGAKDAATVEASKCAGFDTN